MLTTPRGNPYKDAIDQGFKGMGRERCNPDGLYDSSFVSIPH